MNTKSIFGTPILCDGYAPNDELLEQARWYVRNSVCSNYESVLCSISDVAYRSGMPHYSDNGMVEFIYYICPPESLDLAEAILYAKGFNTALVSNQGYFLLIQVPCELGEDDIGGYE